MIRRFGIVCDRLARALVPDPFIFAALLTFLTLLLGVLLAGQSPLQMVLHWGNGFWDLLAFGMQMTLILVTGHALAASPPVRRMIAAVAALPSTPGGAVALVAFCSCAASLLNWGLGLIGGALLAREVGLQAARRGVAVHYPLLAAAGYAGLMVWHGGLSGSAPLTVATPGHFLENATGLVPITETILSPLNLLASAGVLILAPLVLRAMSPAAADSTPVPRAIREQRLEARESAPRGRTAIAERLEQSVPIAVALGAMGLGTSLHQLWLESIRAGSFNLTLNIVNLFMLSAGLLLHGRPRSYLHAVTEGVRGTAGIIVQFPFYAGIMGMMKGSGLVGILSDALLGLSDAGCFPLLAFVSGGIVNLFIPSGGGQWAVQGPILVDAAATLGASLPRTVLAFAYGDQWTNMAQPFWALALLGIVRLRAGEIIGYTIGLMIVSGFWFALVLLLVPG